MADDSCNRDPWERRWEQALREQPYKVASRRPNAHLLGEIEDLRPGRALDAGCGHGAEAIWLAASGWQVTAVDFSVTALEHCRTTAQTLGPEVAERIEWVEGDLGVWAPAPRAFHLVNCLYVHVAESVSELVRRPGSGVAPGGTLFLVGHRPVDPATGAPTPAAGQVQVSVAETVDALDSHEWEIGVAEEKAEGRHRNGCRRGGPRGPPRVTGSAVRRLVVVDQVLRHHDESPGPEDPRGLVR